MISGEDMLTKFRRLLTEIKNLGEFTTVIQFLKEKKLVEK